MSSNRIQWTTFCTDPGSQVESCFSKNNRRKTGKKLHVVTLNRIFDITLQLTGATGSARQRYDTFINPLNRAPQAKISSDCSLKRKWIDFKLLGDLQGHQASLGVSKNWMVAFWARIALSCFFSLWDIKHRITIIIIMYRLTFYISTKQKKIFGEFTHESWMVIWFETQFEPLFCPIWPDAD